MIRHLGTQASRAVFRTPVASQCGSRVLYGPPKQFIAKKTRLFSQIPSQNEVLSKFKFPLSTHTISQVSQDLESFLNRKHDTITLNGHLNRRPRIMAKNIFAELRDTNGDTVQLILSPESSDAKLFKILEKSVPEESVSVSGQVKLKQSRTGAKEWELLVTNYQVLNEANLDVARLDKLKHSSPESLPPQFRYLQLRTPFYQNALRVRSRIASLIRNIFVENHDFVEIETPLLFKSTPEGAREFLVPTRSPNSFYALPQSPQQYKQILMSSGFTRYFQIAKCFRDEDLRSDRQPEFTQVDLEMSFVNNSDQVGVVVEDIIYNIWKNVGKPLYTVNERGNLQPMTDFQPDNLNFYKLSYQEALSQYGIDKPDLRSAISFLSLEAHLKPTKNPQFPILEACVLKQALTLKGSNKTPKALSDPGNYPRRKPYIIPIKTDQDATSWYKTFVEKNIFSKTDLFDEAQMNSLLNLEPGDILAVSDRATIPYENPTPLGKFRQLAINEYPGSWRRQSENEHIKESEVFVVSWVHDFPLFNPVEIDSGESHEYPIYNMTQYESTHHPFTMVKPEDYGHLQNDPLLAKGEHYDLVINGVEVAGGSRRVHDPKLQTYIFRDILQITNYQELFGHLLQALSMGCPPHAGLAIGFDRLCAMIIGSNSIRDVIAFPKNQSGVDPVVDSPSAVAENRLNEYYVGVKK